MLLIHVHLANASEVMVGQKYDPSAAARLANFYTLVNLTETRNSLGLSRSMFFLRLCLPLHWMLRAELRL
jgi:hypothetical protein